MQKFKQNQGQSIFAFVLLSILLIIAVYGQINNI